MAVAKTVVLKPFATSNRRFAVGQEVSSDDDISPHSYADFKARGFIGNEPVAPAKSAPAKADA